MEQSQIDELKASRKDSSKRIKNRISKIVDVECDCSDVRLSEEDVSAIDKVRKHIKLKKLKYAAI